MRKKTEIDECQQVQAAFCENSNTFNTTGCGCKFIWM